MTRQPQTRAELLYHLSLRLKMAEKDGSKVVMLEPWELAWIVYGDNSGQDADGTGQLVGVDFAAVTVQHEIKVRIAGPEQFIQSVDLDEVTHDCEIQT